MITQSYLKRVLHYNPDSGEFRWKEGKRAGKCAVRNSKFGVTIFVNKKQYSARHIAWIYMTGTLPPSGKRVHSKSQNPHSVRWDDLTLDFTGSHRLHKANPTPRSWATRDGKKRSNNSSGVRNVYMHKPSGLWQVRFSVARKQYCFGYFKTIEEAIHVANHERARLGCMI